MRVKKFQARDMADAMRMVKAELGSNAIILHSRDLSRGLMGWFSRGGVEVTAGVDLKQASPPTSPTIAGPTKSGNMISSKALRGGRFDTQVSDTSLPPLSEPEPLLGNSRDTARENSSDAARAMNPLLQPSKMQENNPLLALSQKILQENTQGKNNTIPEKPVSEDPKTSDHQKKVEERLMNLESRLIKLTGLIETLAPSIVSGDLPSVPSHTRELYNHLLEQDVDERLALSIATHLAETTDDNDDVWTALKSYLISKIQVAAPIDLKVPCGRPKVLMLVGPTGVGKTTTLAKISAQYRYNPDTKTRPKIVFITADLYRLAAVEQLQKYTEILGVELEVTYSPDEVRQALKKHKDAHLILFDTAGTCQRNLPQMSTLGSIVEACHPDEVHLVISSTTKYSDMVDIVEHFNEIKPTRLLFTKIDESTTFGPILNMVSKYKLPISYLTIGQNVPEDIECARPDRIAKMLLMKPVVNRAIEDASGSTANESIHPTVSSAKSIESRNVLSNPESIAPTESQIKKQGQRNESNNS